QQPKPSQPTQSTQQQNSKPTQQATQEGKPLYLPTYDNGQTDMDDIALLELINRTPHGPGFYNYLKKLRNYEDQVNKHNNDPDITKDGTRQEDGLVLNDMQYSDYNHL